MTLPPQTAVAAKPSLLYEFFENAALWWPDALAVDVPATRGRPRMALTYAELDQWSAALADVVWHRAGPGTVAAILLPRTTPQLYAAQLGALRAGAAYTCLDPAFPDEQLRHVLSDSGAVVVLTDTAGAQQVMRTGYVGAIVLVDRMLPAVPARPRFSPPPDGMAYLIYTSGTTGQPKGVMVAHRSIANLVGANLAEFGLGPGDRVAQSSSAAYDSSVEEVWLALSCGATVVPLDDETVRLGPDLVKWLRTERITVLCPPPTLLRTMGCANPRAELPDLRLLYVGGEALPEDVAAQWAPGRRMVNGYGPTECTVTCLRTDVVAGQPIAIGRPVPGVQAWVLGEDLQPVADGAEGELCLAGVNLAMGYRNQPELTEAKFPQHPRLGRIYRTGDVVHLGPDGTFFYHGRIDSQVKLRGYRIELEAIEAWLARCSGVREAACRVEGEGPAQVLAAHVVPVSSAAPPDPAALKAELTRVLPVHMVPALIAPIAELPRGVSGKIRRNDLPLLAGAGGTRTAQGPQATDDRQRVIEQAVRRVLPHVDSVGIDDDFFTDLGGSSLQAAMLISALRDSPQTNGLTVRDVYEARTVRRLAERVQAPGPGGASGRSPAKSGRVGRPAPNPTAEATRAQISWLATELHIVAALGYVAVFKVAPWLAGRLGLLAFLVLGSIVSAVGAPLFVPVQVAVAVVMKRLLIGRYTPARVPAWSPLYVRMWIVRQAVRLVPWGSIAGTELQCKVLRALGARIGERVHIHPGVDVSQGGWDLLTIGDDVSIGQDASLRLVDLSAGHLVVGPVTLADGATLEVRAGVGPGTRVGRNSVLCALSSLPPGGVIGDHEVWDGVPARMVAPAARPPALTRQPGLLLSPDAHALVAIGSRSLLRFALGLPFTVGAAALIAWSGIDYPYLLAMFAHPFGHLVAFVATAVLVCLSLVVQVGLEALAARLLGPVSEGVISQWSLDYVRVQLKTELVNSAGKWLSGGLFWPVWLRWAGMRLGRDCEISTIIDVVPELIEIGPGTFFADGIYLGGPRARLGTVQLARTRIGSGTFLGNHAVIPAGQQLPNDILIGVSTVADDRAIRAGTSWFGHPAFELPRREVVEVDSALTHNPSPIRVVNRMFWEWSRFALPAFGLVAVAVWTAAVASAEQSMPPVAMAVGAAGATALAGIALCVFVLGLKWALLGRVRPGTHALWSCWCSRWDFLYVAWGYLASPVLSTLEGTLLLAGYLRAMGMHIGRQVLLGDGFTQIVDPDMIHIEDGATVNAMFQVHTFEDRVLKIDRLHIGAGSTLADNTVPLYGAHVGDGTYVAPHSVIMKREQLLPGLRYEGVPTAPVGSDPANSLELARSHRWANGKHRRF